MIFKEINFDFDTNRILNQEEYYAFVQMMCRGFPELVPEKYNYYEPIKLVFDRLQFSSKDVGNGTTFLWKRKKPALLGQRSVGVPRDPYDSTSIHIEQKVVNTDRMLLFLKDAAASLSTVAAFFQVFNEQEALRSKDHWLLIGYNPAKAHAAWLCPLWKLKRGLPDLTWATVLGPPFVDHLGRDRILSSPAYKVEPVGKERILIQLAATAEEMDRDWDAYNARREAVIDHLGRENFQRLRRPGDPPPVDHIHEHVIPAERVPKEFEKDRDAYLAKKPTPAAIESFDDIFADLDRFVIVERTDENGIFIQWVVDNSRHEALSFADETMRQDLIRRLKSAGIKVNQM